MSAPAVVPAMLSTYIPRQLAEAERIASLLASSGACGKAKPGEVFAVMMAGARYGLDPITAHRTFFVADGKVGIYANGMAGIVRTSGLCARLRCVESTTERATWEGRRTDDAPGEPPVRVTFTREQAVTAGLWDKYTQRGNPTPWVQYPDKMLSARALADLCRQVWPDVVGGFYTRDEIKSGAFEAVDVDFVDGGAPPPAPPVEDAEVVEDEPAGPDLDALRAFYVASPASVRPDLRGCNDAMAAQLVRQFIADHPNAFARWQAGDAPFPEPTTPARAVGPEARVRDALVAVDIDPDTLAALAEAWGGGLDSLARYLSDGALAEPVAAVLDAAASAGDQGEAIDAVASGVATFGVDSMGCAPFVDCIDAQRWRHFGGLLDEVVRRWYDAQRARDEAAR